MRRDLLVLTAAFVVVAAVPMYTTIATLSYGAGTIVGAADLDVVPQLMALKAQTCYRELDGDGAYDPGEPVYLDAIQAVCAVNAKEGDIRLTPSGAYPAGTAVRPGDADYEKPLETDIIGASYAYRDRDADGAWSLGDTLYLDMDADTVAEPGDLRLTASGTMAAGTTVGLTDSDHLAPLVSGSFKDDNLYSWDMNGNGIYDLGDKVFLDADKDGIAEPGDVHLTPYENHVFGELVSANQFYPIPDLKAVSAAWCFIDEDGDAAYDQAETVLLDLVDANCSKGADATDLRLTPSGAAHDLPAFTLIGTGDEDFNAKVYNLTQTTLRHHDLDGTLSFTGGDALYLDILNDGVVTVGDVRLTVHASLTAGQWVKANENDGGLPLREPTFTKDEVAFWDLDGDGKPGPGEPVYLDMDDDGKVEVNDVRLTGVLGAVLDGIAPEEVGAAAEIPEDGAAADGGDDTPDAPTEPSAGGDAAPADKKEKGAPGPVAGAVLAAFLGAAGLVRRRT